MTNTHIYIYIYIHTPQMSNIYIIRGGVQEKNSGGGANQCFKKQRGGGHRQELKYIMYFVASASLAYSSCLILHSVCANQSSANLQPVISLQFDRVSYGIFCWGCVGRKKRVDPGKFPYQIKKNYCPIVRNSYRILSQEKGGTFMYLLREGGGDFLKNRYSEIDLMHFGGTYSHSVLAHAQNNWDSTFQQSQFRTNWWGSSNVQLSIDMDLRNFSPRWKVHVENVITRKMQTKLPLAAIF